jgi:hypothetical protein
VLITLNHLIYLAFWYITSLKLSAVKILTWVWYAITFLDLLVIMGQLALRLVTMNQVPEYIKQQEA